MRRAPGPGVALMKRMRFPTVLSRKSSTTAISAASNTSTDSIRPVTMAR